ncbi:hypothetical protein [Candidatus Amarolinea aalborgensis]|uniref:hypothetical protein n=1 Tax=Candidatus Amarolinea aalborgensis TaxID=2249329 RepID=UPI003BF9A498
MHPNPMRTIFVLLAVTLLIALVTSGVIKNRRSETMTVNTSSLAGNNAGVESVSIKNDGAVTLKNTIVANTPIQDGCDACSPISADGESVDFDDTACPNFLGGR